MIRKIKAIMRKIAGSEPMMKRTDQARPDDAGVTQENNATRAPRLGALTKEERKKLEANLAEIRKQDPNIYPLF